jgi:tetratricopeptide (TPR) repeat protein
MHLHMNKIMTHRLVVRVVLGVTMACGVGMPVLLHGQASSRDSAEIRNYFQEAVRALQANEPAVAVRAYRAILKIDPKNVDALANLGSVAFVQKDWEEAAREFHKALELQPSLWKAEALLGLCELHLGHNSEAVKLLSESFPHLDEPKLHLEAGMQLAELLFQEGEFAQASAIIGDLRNLNPENIAVLYAAYRIYSDQTLQALNSMALVGPDSAQLHLALAEHLVNEGHLEDAIAEYRKAVELNPDMEGLHYELGEALLLESHMEAGLTKAQQEFERALVLNPADARAECELGRIDLWRADSSAAYVHYVRAQKLNPSSTCANLGLAELLTDEGKTQEALSHLQAAAQSDPYDPDTRHRLSNAYRDLGLKEAADRELKAFQELRTVRDSLKKVYEQALPSK